MSNNFQTQDESRWNMDIVMGIRTPEAEEHIIAKALSKWSNIITFLHFLRTSFVTTLAAAFLTQKSLTTYTFVSVKVRNRMPQKN